MTTSSRVHQEFLHLASTLSQPVDVDATMERLTKGAVNSIPGFDQASVSVREGDDVIKTLAPTSDLANQVDLLQYELREGPCYDVLTGGRSTVSTFMADESRWPNFAPRAARLGVGSMMSFEVADRPGWRAGLNLYSSQGGSLDDQAVEIAELFAAHAAVTLGFVHRIAELERGLRTRTVIGEAIGIAMERYKVTHDRAFGLLVRVSNESNVKLRDIAADLVEGTDKNAGGPGIGGSLPTT